MSLKVGTETNAIPDHSVALFQASDIVRGVSRLRDFNMPVFVAQFCLFVIE